MCVRTFSVSATPWGERVIGKRTFFANLLQCVLDNIAEDDGNSSYSPYSPGACQCTKMAREFTSAGTSVGNSTNGRRSHEITRVARYQETNLPITPPRRTEGVNHGGYGALSHWFGLILVSCGTMVCLGHTRNSAPCCFLLEPPSVMATFARPMACAWYRFFYRRTDAGCDAVAVHMGPSWASGCASSRTRVSSQASPT
jgi:hypothetical protein